jgi:putative oxidoreductase
MEVIRKFTIVLARFLISLVFLAGAANKILHWHETERSLMNTLCEWQSNIGFSENLQDCLAAFVPWTPILMIVATLFELLGGLSILLGIKERLGAALLVLFLIPTTILIHQFWFIDGMAREVQITHFLKNLAIMGGLFLIIVQGTERAKNPFSTKFG